MIKQYFLKLVLIILGVFFTNVLVQKKDKTTEVVNVNFDNYFFGNVLSEIEADEFSYFQGGYMIIRKANQYSVIDEFGKTVISYGKYIFNIQEQVTKNKEGIYNNNFILVRSPETGLY
ncbi:hypothetical protein [Chryseobacterium sp. CCH4-E10]|uniref:hypothetical protein n=1 Tax=Chryseobacterium sp. CCH4-E10 TaxID=1768758 RepID=UPI000832DAE7|nr:hypothetical protein [Chryseobacterium sp. CCH4-E10]